MIVLMDKLKQGIKHLLKTKGRKERGNTLRLIHPALIWILIPILQTLNLIQIQVLIPILIPILQVHQVMVGAERREGLQREIRFNIERKGAINEGIGKEDDMIKEQGTSPNGPVLSHI